MREVRALACVLRRGNCYDAGASAGFEVLGLGGTYSDCVGVADVVHVHISK